MNCFNAVIIIMHILSINNVFYQFERAFDNLYWVAGIFNIDRSTIFLLHVIKKMAISIDYLPGLKISLNHQITADK